MRTLTDGTTGALNRQLASGVSYNIPYDTRPDSKKQMRQARNFLSKDVILSAAFAS